jgi:hypothetical protein
MWHRHVRRIVKGLPLLREVEHLIPLALADGVVAHRRHTVSRQQDRRTLILAYRLAIMAVPARHQHRRPRTGRLRQIQISRHMKSRAALKQDLLHAIRFPLQGAHHLRLQRCALRQSADLFQKKGLPFLLPRPHRGLALDHLLKRLAASVHHPVKLLLQPHLKLLVRLDPSGRRFQDREIFRRMSHGCGEENRKEKTRKHPSHTPVMDRTFFMPHDAGNALHFFKIDATN